MRKRILNLFTPKTLENRAALRTAIATIIAIMCAFILHLDKPYWSGMTVILLANLYSGNIIDKVVMRILGTIIGVSLGFFLASFIANNLLLYLLGNFFIVGIGIYYYNSSSYTYTYFVAVIGAFLVVAQLAIDYQNTFLVAIWRPIEISLGVLVSAAAAFCLFPNHISEQALNDVDSIFTSLKDILEELKIKVPTGKSDFVKLQESNLQFKKKLRKLKETTRLMRRELGVTYKQLAQIKLLTELFYDLSRTITYFILSYKEREKNTDLTDIFYLVTPVFTAAQDDLRLLRDAFFLTGKKNPILQTRKTVEKFQLFIKSHVNESLEVIVYLCRIESLLQKINTTIANLNSILINQQPLHCKSKQVISSQRQLRHDPDIIKHSLKIGLTTVIALSFWLVTNWPGGLNGVMSSIILSIRKNLFEMKNASLYRILGCIAGGGVALLPLAFLAIDLYDLIIILFFSIWGFSYFSFKHTQYTYIGLQANIALIISLAQTGEPPLNLIPPLERLGGIFIGIAASFLVGNILWRTDLLNSLSKHIQKISSSLSHNIIRLLLNKKENLYELTDLFWSCYNLLESLPEKQSNTKKQKELINSRNDFAQTIFVYITINHIYSNIDQQKARATATLLGIELHTIEQAIIDLYRLKKNNDIALIQLELNSIIVRIQSIIGSHLSHGEIYNCLGYIKSLELLINKAQQITSLTMRHRS